MTLKVKFQNTDTVCIIPDVEYIRRVDEKRNVRTMHFYEIKLLDAPFPVKYGTTNFYILEITQ